MTAALIRYTALHLTLILSSSQSGAVYAQEQPKPKLQILIIGGEGSINNVKQRTAREPVVEVQDENNRPVAGAVVLFKAPDFGASGTFPDGSKALRVTTNAQGRAAGRGFRPNMLEGSMELQVTASFGGAFGSAVIHMRNTAGGGAGGGKGSGSGKIIAIVAGVAGAAAVGLAVGLKGGKGNTPPGPGAPLPTTITLGTGTVGPRP